MKSRFASGKGDQLSSAKAEALFYEQIPQATVELCVGAPTFIVDCNPSAVRGIANGTKGLFHSISFKDEINKAILIRQFILQIEHAAAGDIVDIPTGLLIHSLNIDISENYSAAEISAWPLSETLSAPNSDNLTQSIIVPISRPGKPKTYNFTNVVDGVPRVSVKVDVAPPGITLAFSITCHKVQGATLDRIILYLQRSKFSIQLDLTSIYVLLSRVREYKHLRIWPLRKGENIKHLQEIERDMTNPVWFAGFETRIVSSSTHRQIPRLWNKDRAAAFDKTFGIKTKKVTKVKKITTAKVSKARPELRPTSSPEKNALAQSPTMVVENNTPTNRNKKGKSKGRTSAERAPHILPATHDRLDGKSKSLKMDVEDTRSSLFNNGAKTLSFDADMDAEDDCDEDINADDECVEDKSREHEGVSSRPSAVTVSPLVADCIQKLNNNFTKIAGDGSCYFRAFLSSILHERVTNRYVVALRLFLGWTMEHPSTNEFKSAEVVSLIRNLCSLPVAKIKKAKTYNADSMIHTTTILSSWGETYKCGSYLLPFWSLIAGAPETVMSDAVKNVLVDVSTRLRFQVILHPYYNGTGLNIDHNTLCDQIGINPLSRANTRIRNRALPDALGLLSRPARCSLEHLLINRLRPQCCADTEIIDPTTQEFQNWVRANVSFIIFNDESILGGDGIPKLEAGNHFECTWM